MLKKERNKLAKILELFLLKGNAVLANMYARNGFAMSKLYKNSLLSMHIGQIVGLFYWQTCAQSVKQVTNPSLLFCQCDPSVEHIFAQ